MRCDKVFCRVAKIQGLEANLALHDEDKRKDLPSASFVLN